MSVYTDKAWRQQEAPDREDYSGYCDELDDELETCRRCFAPLDDAGDGYDGLCPSCADREESGEPLDDHLEQSYDSAQGEGFDFNPIDQGMHDDDPDVYSGTYSEE